MLTKTLLTQRTRTHTPLFTLSILGHILPLIVRQSVFAATATATATLAPRARALCTALHHKQLLGLKHPHALRGVLDLWATVKLVYVSKLVQSHLAALVFTVVVAGMKGTAAVLHLARELEGVAGVDLAVAHFRGLGVAQ